MSSALGPVRGGEAIVGAVRGGEHALGSCLARGTGPKREPRAGAVRSQFGHPCGESDGSCFPSLFYSGMVFRGFLWLVVSLCYLLNIAVAAAMAMW